MSGLRVGIGYDIHRLVPGDSVVLGGVRILHDQALTGHSDADVVIHAVIDALLGAASLGDIGTHFPPTRDDLAGVSSLTLLGQTAALLADAGYEVVNIDLAIVAEAPRIGSHVDEMKIAIAQALSIDPSLVGIKATTNEGVGPEGRREAISSQAVALIERKA